MSADTQRTTVGIVLYGTPPEELADLFANLRDSPAVVRWVVCDNAASERPAAAAELKAFTESLGGHYLPAERNLGFGGGHNLALRSLRDVPSDFHLMVNPDITMSPEILPALQHVMDSRPSVSLILPRVLYPDGTDQYLAKLLPTPLDFALRRFAPAAIQRLAGERLAQYELRGLASVESDRIPFLSGCFMFTRRATLEAVGGFDDRYFLYMEDVDLCRRLAAVSTLLYYPALSVLHAYHRGAHRSRRLMVLFLRSSVVYFNRWGWFWDRRRKQANAAAIAQLKASQRGV